MLTFVFRRFQTVFESKTQEHAFLVHGLLENIGLHDHGLPVNTDTEMDNSLLFSFRMNLDFLCLHLTDVRRYTEVRVSTIPSTTSEKKKVLVKDQSWFGERIAF
ncbi:hypothetical protein ABEB36_001521 [Hypothenemus hampei]|uniref:Uncharacterized protein n=1 Tax=Hypothenemus hampei TaxID=57062 RepID=A0ABD1FEW0_HYPHA